MVLRGQVEVETQVLYTPGEVGAEMLARWSPLSRFELRLGAPSYTNTDFGSGFSDPSVGAKVAFGPLGGWDIGVVAALSLPVADALFGSGTADPALVLAAFRALGATEVGGQLVAERDDAAGSWLYATTVTVLVPLGDVWTGYAELDAVFADDPALLPHIGTSYALSPLVSLDAHGGLGLTDATPAVLIGAGLTVSS